MSIFALVSKSTVMRSTIIRDTIFEINKTREKSTINLADPTIFYHKGTYYLYGTGGEKQNDQGFVVYTSTDLKSWSVPVGATGGYAFKKGDGFGKRGFWAPQVYHFQNKFYMAYTANEHIAIAVSDSPLGPFKQEKKKPLITQKRNIDPFIFIDDDGKKYLYHVIVDNGGNRIFAAEMEDDLSAIKPKTLVKCIEAETTWENIEKAAWSVTEGPTVIKQGNLYYLIYSANDFRSPDYAVGYAVSKNPLGPWKKFEGNPILGKFNTGKKGSGHGDLFKDKNGDWLYVFHTHNAENRVSPRKTALVEATFNLNNRQKLKLDANSFHYLLTEK